MGRKASSKGKCVVEGCNHPATIKGYCVGHYTRTKRYNTPTPDHLPKLIYDADKKILDQEGKKGSRKFTKCKACQKKIYYVGEKPEVCPYCGCKYYTKPITEIRLFELQEKYLKNRDQKILAEMFKIVKSYSQSLILKITKGYKFDPLVLDERAHDAAATFIANYLAKDGFKIDKSFAGYLRYKCNQVLYGDKNWEQNFNSLDAPIPQKGSGEAEFRDILYQEYGIAAISTEEEYHEYSKEACLNNIMKLIDDFTAAVKVKRGVVYSTYLLILLEYELSKNKFKIEKFKNIILTDIIMRREIIELLDLLMMNIYKILKNIDIIEED